MTNSWTDIKNADLIIVMGGNAAEAHPVGFKWVIEAKIRNGAKVIWVPAPFQFVMMVLKHIPKPIFRLLPL